MKSVHQRRSETIESGFFVIYFSSTIGMTTTGDDIRCCVGGRTLTSTWAPTVIPWCCTTSGKREGSLSHYFIPATVNTTEIVRRLWSCNTCKFISSSRQVSSATIISMALLQLTQIYEMFHRVKRGHEQKVSRAAVPLGLVANGMFIVFDGGGAGLWGVPLPR